MSDDVMYKYFFDNGVYTLTEDGWCVAPIGARVHNEDDEYIVTAVHVMFNAKAVHVHLRKVS